MPKKRKTQQKPLDRRFAVTSIPKKAPASAVEQGDAKGEEPSTVGTPPQTLSIANPLKTKSSMAEGLMSGLYRIVDRLQEKTEKEIVRTVKAIETERKFSDTFPLLDLDRSIVDEILALVRDSQHGEANISDRTALARLGITYGVLRRLGYSEEFVERCLHFIDGVDLEEAHEWLFMYCTDEEFQPHTRELLVPTLPSSYPRKLVHAGSKASTPKPKSISALLTPTLSASAQSSLPAQPPSSTRLAELLDNDPNILYARLKLELYKRTRTPSGDSEESLIEELRSHLDAVKSHYLFDQRDAEAHYISRRQKSDESPYKRAVPLLHHPKEVRGDSTDLFDSNEQEDEGLFEILDIPSTDISETGVTVRVRNMLLN
ncbi:hypothetical protein EDB83DRAFT_2523576 [Lactarius deliciosus]|nr:hypothetical protein EDB83DRAFT_2523576 [Lactarius deliciosus]